MTEVEPQFVIIVPTYNCQATVAETLLTIQTQDIEALKMGSVLVCDDGSSDETVSIARNAWNLGNVKYSVLQSERNHGQWRNVNEAIASIEGAVDWIVILHSDDVAKAGWLPRTVDRMRTCDKDVGTVCSSWDDWYPDGTVVPGENAADLVRKILGGTAAVRGTLKQGCWWHISGSAIRTETIGDVGYFREDLHQIADWQWLLRMLGKGWAVEYLPQSLIKYRHHTKSVSSVNFQANRDVFERLLVVDEHRNDLRVGERSRVYMNSLSVLIRRGIKRQLMVRTQKETLTRFGFVRLLRMWAGRG